ncbi:MAG: glycosyltransferase family 4 protein [Treponema sp.]|nr:glycosyltransferase family 4 protein [Treponema sp.]
MKLAVDCRLVGESGIGTYISEIVPYFLESHSCLLLGSSEQCEPYLKSGNAEFCPCDVPLFSAAETLFFPKHIAGKINECDAFFTPYCNIPSSIRIPIFSTIHDVVFLDVPGLTGTIGRLARKFFYQRAINKSKSIFTVSEFSKSRILANMRCKKNIVVTHSATPNHLRQKVEDAPRTNTILFVGNIKKHKGLSILLEAYEKARQKGFDKKLVIVGNAEHFRTGDAQTIEKLSRIGKETVIFTGKISNDKLRQYYAEADFLVQPSLYEGFGLPPQEALFQGTPSLISDIPVFKEVYEHFPVTFFASGNADDLAQKMLSMKTDRLEIGTNAETYNFKKTSSRILAEIGAQLGK